MFETYNVKNTSILVTGVMSLYASGRTTGLVVDCGDGVSYTVPIFEGFSVPHAVKKIEITGRVMTDYLSKLLLENIG